MSEFKVNYFDEDWCDIFAGAESFITGENPIIGENESGDLIIIDRYNITFYHNKETILDNAYLPKFNDDRDEITVDEAWAFFKLINLNPESFINGVLTDWIKI